MYTFQFHCHNTTATQISLGQINSVCYSSHKRLLRIRIGEAPVANSGSGTCFSDKIILASPFLCMKISEQFTRNLSVTAFVLFVIVRHSIVSSNDSFRIPWFDGLLAWDTLTLTLLTWTIWRALRMLANGGWDLTLTLLTWTIWRAPTNASKWRMGFNPYPANVNNMASSYQC